ncbi:hypothetical protein DL96DRAFT_261888 [Flagelloscypha sp. PMI_526]|nr:hypothetical protein DL96DRAFT_261888 [Flagelloscypha sp. PMI_526]
MKLNVLEESPLHWTLNCEIKYGAILIPKDPPTQFAIHPSPPLVEYIRSHYQEWYTFIETLQECPQQILDCSGLLLVTGLHRNSAWAVGAWRHTGEKYILSHTTHKPGQSDGAEICGWHPTGSDSVREGPSTQSSVPENEDVNQTLFIEGYRIRRRGRLETIPSQDGQVQIISPPTGWLEWLGEFFGFGGQENGDKSPDPPGYPPPPSMSTTRPLGSAENNLSQGISLTPIHSEHFPRHPLDDLTDDIFELLPEAQTVIVHDQDMRDLNRLGENIELASYLDRHLEQSEECTVVSSLSSFHIILILQACSLHLHPWSPSQLRQAKSWHYL